MRLRYLALRSARGRGGIVFERDDLTGGLIELADVDRVLREADKTIPMLTAVESACRLHPWPYGKNRQIVLLDELPGECHGQPEPAEMLLSADAREVRLSIHYPAMRVGPIPTSRLLTFACPARPGFDATVRCPVPQGWLCTKLFEMAPGSGTGGSGEFAGDGPFSDLAELIAGGTSARFDFLLAETEAGGRELSVRYLNPSGGLAVLVPTEVVPESAVEFPKAAEPLLAVQPGPQVTLEAYRDLDGALEPLALLGWAPLELIQRVTENFGIEFYSASFKEGPAVEYPTRVELSNLVGSALAEVRWPELDLVETCCR